MIDTTNIPIGYIFPNARVVDRKNHKGFWILKDSLQKKALFLKDTYIPKGTTINRGDSLKDLVVIGFGYGSDSIHVAMSNYQQDLFHYYYCQNNSYWPKKKNWRVWQNRWQIEYGEDFKNTLTVNTSVYKANDLNLDIFWLKGSDYILPVFGYKDLLKLDGRLLFCPNMFTGKYQIDLSVYKTDNFNNLPQMYKAKITGEGLSGDITKDVIIFFHGFTYPAKWHFDIWKHVFALTPGVSEKERTFWEKLWDETIPGPGSLFKSCKTAKAENTCDENACLSLSLFENVHSKIKNFCKKYLEQFVTSFESNTTNSIVLFKGPFNSTEITLKYTKQWAGIYQKTLLYGTCYNWNDTKPVLHVNPVTMFLDDKFAKDWLIKDIEDNECKKNSRPIFDGNLSEIIKCS